MTEDHEEVLVPAQREVRVFINTAGDIAIVLSGPGLYETDCLEEAEQTVTVPLHYVPALIQRLQKLLAEGGRHA